MKRRIIKQSDSYTITLPIKWVKGKGLKPGDELDVGLESGKLIIDTEAKAMLAQVEVGMVDKSNLLQAIGTAYRAGYVRIILKLQNEIGMSKIQNIVDFFTGLEIEELSSKKVILRCVTTVRTEEYDFFVKKTFLTIKLMIEEILNFMDGETPHFSNIEEMRKNNLKSREYCMRAINMKSVGKKGACDEYAFIHILERISGLLWFMGQYLENNEVKKTAKIKELLLFLEELIDKSYHVYLKKDYEAGIKDVLSEKSYLRDIWYRQNKILKLYKSKGVDPILFSLILDIKDNISAAMERFLSTVMEMK